MSYSNTVSTKYLKSKRKELSNWIALKTIWFCKGDAFPSVIRRNEKKIAFDSRRIEPELESLNVEMFL